MLEKLGSLLKSVRFWQVTAAAVVQVFAFYIPDFVGLANIITGYLGVVITIGSVDSFATKFGAARK